MYLSSTNWEASLEIEAFLARAQDIKDVVEHHPNLTAAQGFVFMTNLLKSCTKKRSLSIKLFPASSTLADRTRKRAVVAFDKVHPMIAVARTVMAAQINTRFLQYEPSEPRMVQMFMCKQHPMAGMPPEWELNANGFYLKWLRAADSHLRTGGSPAKHTRKKSRRPEKFVRKNLLDMLSDEEGDADEAAPMDAVGLEVSAWATLDPETVKLYQDSSGLLDEFKLMYNVRKTFPLHYHVFRQVSAHILTEANCEDFFSLTGRLSNENGCTEAAFMSRLARISRNKSGFTPNPAALYKAYLKKFNKVNFGEDVVECDASDDSEDSEEEEV